MCRLVSQCHRFTCARRVSYRRIYRSGAQCTADGPGDKGTVFVGSRNAGNVYAVVDTDADFRADKVFTIARQLLLPSGIAFKDRSLYVAAVNRILRYADIESRLQSPPKRK